MPAAAAMAPLLGRKPFPLVKPLPGEEALFTIPHTQEAFRTREYPFSVRAVDARPRLRRARDGDGEMRMGRAQLAGQLSPHRAIRGPRCPGPAWPGWDPHGGIHPAVSIRPSWNRAPPSFPPLLCPRGLGDDRSTNSLLPNLASGPK